MGVQRDLTQADTATPAVDDGRSDRRLRRGDHAELDHLLGGRSLCNELRVLFDRDPGPEASWFFDWALIR